MERNNRRKPTQLVHNNDSNTAVPNASWLDWNVNNFDNGANTTGIDDSEKASCSNRKQRSTSTPKQRRENQNDNSYGKLHSPTKKKHHGISLQMIRPKSAGKQRPISATKSRTSGNDAHAKSDHSHTATKQGGEGSSKHHSWASGLLLRKKHFKANYHHENSNSNNHRLAAPSTSNGNTGNKEQTKKRNTNAPNNICDYCQQVVHNKSRSQMYQRAGYAYCSTTCTKFHHQALDAEENGQRRIDVGTDGGNHVPSQSNAIIGNNTKVINTESKSSIQLRRLEQDHQQHTQQQQQNHHLMNVSYEDSTGNQFIPSMTKAAAAAATTASSIPQTKAQFPQNWFHQNNAGSDDGDIDIIGDKSTISFGNSWVANGAQPSQEGQSSTQSSDSLPDPTNNNYETANRYGRGITDEYQDYNDELSRQLRLAARQDELQMEERMMRRHKFITTHHHHHQQQYQPLYGQPSPGTLSSVSSNATGSDFSTRSGGFWSGGACDSSSPGQYQSILKNMGVDGLSATKSTNGSNRRAMKNNAKETSNSSRPKYPILKQNENSTQSTESVSSSSQGVTSSHDIGSRNSGNVGKFSFSSLGDLDVDNRPEFDVALRNDFPNDNNEKMNNADMKTPRKGNLSVVFAGLTNVDEDHGTFQDAPGGAAERIDPTDGKEDDHLSKNRTRNHNHYMLSKSLTPPSSTLYAISEEQSVGPMDAPASNKGGDFASFQFLAQKRGLRPIAPPPTSSSSSSKGQMSNGISNNHVRSWADHAVEDVVSIVSYYDDPSVDMLSSLATNDTFTTTSQQRAGRRSPPFTRSPSGGAQTSLNKTGKSQQDQPRCDPPGNSIDEILKEGVLRHQQGRDAHHNGRDASFQGVDPDEDNQLMVEDENNVEQSPARIKSRQTRRDFKNIAHSRIRPEEKPHNSNYHPQGNEKLQFGRIPDISAPPKLRSSQQNRIWSDNDPTDNMHGHQLVSEDIKDKFDVGGIEFPTHELFDGDDTSIGMLTGEEEDDPPLSGRGDDDTATNTLDTVDLVAEVKRVWRHVQRYETKKHRKKELKRQLRKNNRLGAVDAADDDKVLNDIDDDAAERIRENDNMLMGKLLHQFSEMDHEPRYYNDCDSKLSDITPFSSSNRVQRSRSRGRTSERPPIIPNDGRLGKHIRSTSSHSCTHVEPPDSPGLDSNQAMASRASTEKDAVFLNEGVDEFYEGQTKQTMSGHGHNAAPHSASSSALQQNSRIRQLRTQYLNKVQPNSQKGPNQHSSGHNDEDNKADEMKVSEIHKQHLSTPYDMTKTKSSGTSFTQQTQQTSNMTTTQSSKLRTDMARKYLKQKPHSNSLGQQHQRQQHQQPKQPESPSRLYTKATQNTRMLRTSTNNRIS